METASDADACARPRLTNSEQVVSHLRRLLRTPVGDVCARVAANLPRPKIPARDDLDVDVPSFVPEAGGDDQLSTWHVGKMIFRYRTAAEFSHGHVHWATMNWFGLPHSEYGGELTVAIGAATAALMESVEQTSLGELKRNWPAWLPLIRRPKRSWVDELSATDKEALSGGVYFFKPANNLPRDVAAASFFADAVQSAGQAMALLTARIIPGEDDPVRVLREAVEAGLVDRMSLVSAFSRIATGANRGEIDDEPLLRRGEHGLTFASAPEARARELARAARQRESAGHWSLRTADAAGSHGGGCPGADLHLDRDSPVRTLSRLLLQCVDKALAEMTALPEAEQWWRELPPRHRLQAPGRELI